MRRLGLSVVTALGALCLSAIAAHPTRAQNNHDWVIQNVCVVGGVVTSQDPAGPCTGGATRDLQVGERLPYHRSDLNGFNWADSWPIHDPDGVSIAIHSKFFTDALNTDPRFPNSVHWDPLRGSYDVYGSDGTTVFARGTGDSTNFWSPWWDETCQAKAWASFPDGPSAFAYGGGTTQIAAAGLPDCSVPIQHGTSNHYWNYGPYTYVNGRTLNTIYSVHKNSNANEDFYYTREYGVTRWEAWSTTPGTPASVQANCPNIPYSKMIDGVMRYLNHCHDWTVIVPVAGGWSPFDMSGSALQWPIDPLYTNGNILQNTHFGGPPSPGASPSCNVAPWTITSPPQILNWNWQTGVSPMSGGFNCSLMISTPAYSSGAGLQQAQEWSWPEDWGPIPRLTFGAILWAPSYTGGTPPQVLIRLREISGSTLVASHDLIVDVTDKPAAFGRVAKVGAGTTDLIMQVIPINPNVQFGFTGAWINQEP